MSMIRQLEAACAKYEKRIEEIVHRVTDDEWGDHNPGAIAGLYADLKAMTTDLYQRRQHAENKRLAEEAEGADNGSRDEAEKMNG